MTTVTSPEYRKLFNEYTDVLGDRFDDLDTDEVARTIDEHLKFIDSQVFKMRVESQAAVVYVNRRLANRKEEQRKLDGSYRVVEPAAAPREKKSVAMSPRDKSIALIMKALNCDREKAERLVDED